jgi:hypothetical protein
MDAPFGLKSHQEFILKSVVDKQTGFMGALKRRIFAFAGTAASPAKTGCLPIIQDQSLYP